LPNQLSVNAANCRAKNNRVDTFPLAKSEDDLQSHYKAKTINTAHKNKQRAHRLWCSAGSTAI